jgi:ubiquitin C-terminal hydrolase
MKYPVNNNNSCYIDSLLVVLHKVFDMKVLLRNGSTDLSKKFRRALTSLDIKTFRILAATVDNKMASVDWLYDQKEPLDVLMFLQNHFKFSNNVIYRETYYNKKGGGKLDFVKEKIKRHVFFDTQYVTPLVDTRLTLDESIHIKNDDGGSTQVIKRKFIDAPIALVHINRGVNGNEKLLSKVFMPCRTGNMHLSGVLVHFGGSIGSGHYVGYYKEGTKWYEYDDMNGSPRLIGRELPALVYRNCTDILYVRRGR